MPPRFDIDTLEEVNTLIASTVAGARIPAATAHVRTAIGNNFSVTLKRNTIIVYDAVWSGQVTAEGNKLKVVGQPTTVSTDTAADKDTGTWELLIRNVSTGRLIHFEAAEFTMSLDLDGSNDLYFNLTAYFDPNIDPVVSNNSLDQVIANMRLPHAERIKGVDYSVFAGWKSGPGLNGFGADLRGSNAPTWWTSQYSAYLNDTRYTLLAPWCEIFTGVNNQATHTWVQFRNWRLLHQRQSDLGWSVLLTINAANRMTADYFDPGYWAVGAATVYSDANGIILRPATTTNNFLHFYGGADGPFSVSNFDPADTRCIATTVEHRLITDGVVDDRAQARLMWRMAADAIPNGSVPTGGPGDWRKPAGFTPEVGGTGAPLITSQWGRTTFATLGADVCYQGGRRAQAGTSTFGASSGPSEVQFRLNPPPL